MKALKVLAVGILAKYLMIISYLVGFVSLVFTENIAIFGIMSLVSIICLAVMFGAELIFITKILRNKE